VAKIQYNSACEKFRSAVYFVSKAGHVREKQDVWYYPIKDFFYKDAIDENIFLPLILQTAAT
jgi:hypothetical protein